MSQHYFSCTDIHPTKCRRFFFSFFFFALTSVTFFLIMQFFKAWKSLIRNGSILECRIFPLDVFSVILMQKDTWNMILVCIYHSTNIFSFLHFVFCLNLLLFHFRTDRKHLAWMIYREYNVWIHFDHYFCIHITVGSLLTLQMGINYSLWSPGQKKCCGKVVGLYSH